MRIDAPLPPPTITGASMRTRFVRSFAVVLLLMGVAALAASAAPRRVVAPPVQVLGVVEPPAPTAPPPTAPAPTAPPPTAPPPAVLPAAQAPPPREQVVGASALALLPIDPATRLPGWEIAFLPGRSGIRALTHPQERRIEVYVRADDTPEGLQRVLAHELGHALDVVENDDRDRERWRAARGIGAEVPWWPQGTTYDFDTVAGDFAEAVAAWLVGSESVARVAGPFTPEQLALVAELVG